MGRTCSPLEGRGEVKVTGKAAVRAQGGLTFGTQGAQVSAEGERQRAVPCREQPGQRPGDRADLPCLGSRVQAGGLRRKAWWEGQR